MSRMQIFVAATTAFIWAHVAEAAGNEVAEQLGVIIASEELCGHAYEQAAVEAFISEYVPADDAEFPGQLAGQIAMRKAYDQNITATEKTARCAQVTRLAKHFGFVK